MTHEDIKILISAYIDGEVSPSEKIIVEEHLKECASCQKDFRMYKSISSSLSKWPNEDLSPDESIKMQRRFEKRREPMFTQRSIMALGTTLALTLIIGSVVQTYVKRGVQGRLKSAANDIGDQYSDGNTYSMRASRVAYAPAAIPSQAAGQVVLATSENQNAAYDAQGFAMKRNLNARYGLGMAGNINGAMAQAAFSGGYGQQLASATAQSLEKKEHKVIKNAYITLKVQNAEKTQSDLETLVTKFEGVIINFQISKLEDGSRKGFLVFKVLPKKLKDLLPELRKLGEVQSENQSGVDITNEYEYLQTRLGNYQTNKERLEKIIKRNFNDPGVVLDAQSELTSTEANMNAIENSLNQLDDQSYMATVVVNFYDIFQMTPKVITFKDKFFTTFKDNFKSTLETCYALAINSFNGIVIVLSFLVQVAIWALLFWGIYSIVSRFFKK